MLAFALALRLVFSGLAYFTNGIFYWICAGRWFRGKRSGAKRSRRDLMLSRNKEQLYGRGSLRSASIPM